MDEYVTYLEHRQLTDDTLDDPCLFYEIDPSSDWQFKTRQEAEDKANEIFGDECYEQHLKPDVYGEWRDIYLRCDERGLCIPLPCYVECEVERSDNEEHGTYWGQ